MRRKIIKKNGEYGFIFQGDFFAFNELSPFKDSSYFYPYTIEFGLIVSLSEDNEFVNLKWSR